ncbi:MAG: MFS transporter, partial [Bacteroidota bacterium]
VTIAPSLGVHIAGTVVLGLGLSGILGSSLSYILLSESSVDERAVAQGLSTIFISVGQLAGAALLAALAASATTSSVGYRMGFGVVAGTGLLLALLGLGLRRKPS